MLNDVKKIFVATGTIAILAGSAVLFHTHSHADLIRIDEIRHVLNYAQNADLVVFDIDWTLITAISQDSEGNTIDWSNTHYFDAIDTNATNANLQKYTQDVIQTVKKANINVDESRVKKAFAYYLKHFIIRHGPDLWDKYIWPHATTITVEPETILAIKQLTDLHIPIVLYTSRQWEERSETERQLHQAGVKFNRITVFDKQLIMKPHPEEPRGFGFDNGILYWIKNASYKGHRDASKGPVLLKFLDAINLHPKKIVFVDDTKERIQNIASLLKSRAINSSVLWYRGIEKRIKPIKELSAADLHVLNTYLPHDWQYEYATFDLHKACTFVIDSLQGNSIQTANPTHA